MPSRQEACVVYQCEFGVARDRAPRHQFLGCPRNRIDTLPPPLIISPFACICAKASTMQPQWIWRMAPLLSGVLLLLSSAGCTATRFRVEPFRSDVVQARLLQQRAREVCCKHRGATDLPPHAFTSDGCSMWPDGDWVECCIEHDIAYWCGGTPNDRRRADATLAQCVASHEHPCLSTVMYNGLRGAGALPLPLPFRWAYGWDWPHRYDEPRPGECPTADAPAQGAEGVAPVRQQDR